MYFDQVFRSMIYKFIRKCIMNGILGGCYVTDKNVLIDSTIQLLRLD